MYSIIHLAEEVRDSAGDLRRDLKHVLKYLASTESHVYAFSIAANVLLAFWPFLLVMITLCRQVLQWPAAERAIYATVRDFFAGDTGAFLERNLVMAASWHRRLEWMSMLLLLFTANGVFLPLEVALNRAWGVKENRSLLKNQVVSMALIFGCGALALISAMLTGAGLEAYRASVGGASEAPGFFSQWLAHLASIPVTVLILYLIYCYLPNVEIPRRAVLAPTIVVALALEILKWINLGIWPWLRGKFEREYGVFVNTVTILTWSFFAGLVVLAGAEWIARRVRGRIPPTPDAGPIHDRMGSESHIHG